MWKLKNILLNNQWVKEEIARGLKKYFQMTEKETQHSKIYRLQQ